MTLTNKAKEANRFRNSGAQGGHLCDLQRTDGELVEAEHVHDADLRQDRRVQVRPLVRARRHQQPAVAAALRAREYVALQY